MTIPPHNLCSGATSLPGTALQGQSGRGHEGLTTIPSRNPLDEEATGAASLFCAGMSWACVRGGRYAQEGRGGDNKGLPQAGEGGAVQERGEAMPSLSLLPGHRHRCTFLPAVIELAASHRNSKTRGAWRTRRYAVAVTIASSDRQSMTTTLRKGAGTAIVWFRNDLRISDNEALLKAWQSSQAVVPLYCVDPRLYGTTHTFGFPKTGELRAQFILESVADLRSNLQQRGLDLIIRQGKPEDIVPSIAKAIGAHTVFAHKETCSEETAVEKGVKRGLAKLEGGPKMGVGLQFVWGGTLYHLDDLPFSPAELPDVYTQFRKGVEYNCKIRPALKMPAQMGPLPENLAEKVGAPGDVPTVGELGLTYREQSPLGVMHFEGGETAALARLQDYFWKKDMLKVYKETRNGMVGADYSTKFSPWLAHGCLSPRTIHDEVKRYENERVSNDSTYWVLFELIWRDYFRFVSIKYGNAFFHIGGPRKVVGKLWSQNRERFEAWREARTGYPLIDANMKELAATGFMSNRGRQIVCSFLVRDLGLDWRMGAEWFETCLLDYDPCSNYGNWTYGAGVGNDPREDRYFSIPKQASTYDPEGEYVAHWLVSLKQLPPRQRNSPGDAYLRPIVPLKFGMAGGGGKPNYARFGNNKKVGKVGRR